MTPIDRSRLGRNNKNRGKTVERFVARTFFGTERQPTTGRGGADIETATHVVEVKSRQQPTPALMREAWQQVTGYAILTGKQPVVVLAYKDDGRWSYWRLEKLETHGAPERPD